MNGSKPLAAVLTSKEDIELLANQSTQILDAEESRKTSLLKNHEDRMCSRAAHVLKRLMLTIMDGQPGIGGARIKPQEWRFGHTIYGKPLVHPSCSSIYHFSISHTRGGVACAVSPDIGVSIGIDIERCFRDPLENRVERHVFTSDEIINASSLHHKAKALHHSVLWTLKEAWLKAVGLGLNLPMNKVGFIGQEIRITKTHVPYWINSKARILDLVACKGYVSSCIDMEIQAQRKSIPDLMSSRDYEHNNGTILLMPAEITTLSLNEILERSGFNNQTIFHD
jgi:4'-phosphopantetheinyl transferase